jgi:hypothetical protein
MANDLRRLWGREESGWAESKRSRHSATAVLAGKPIAAEREIATPLPPEGGLARAGVTTRKCYFCVDR